MASPRILFVDQTGQLGGAELCLADIAAHFRATSRVLLLSDGPFGKVLRARGVAVSVLPLPSAWTGLSKKAGIAATLAGVPAVPRFLSAMRRNMADADLIYLNTAKALVQGALAGLGSGRPAIYHLHDILDAAHFSRLNIGLLVGAANRMRAVIANSQATADAFVRAGGKRQVYVIPNGFDSSPFDNVSAGEIAALRAKFNPEGRPVAAIFGRLTPWKGQHLLLEAASRLKDVTIWVIGDALFTDEDRAYATSLRRASAGNIRFLGFRQDVPALLQAADIAVNCSVAAEPFGRVLVEAMMARKPVVAPRAGGPCEIVEDEATGLLVPPNDPAALASALHRLAEDSDLRRQMGQRGRERADRLYSLPAVLAQTESVLREMLA